MEEKQLFGALTVYRERGGYLRRREQYNKSRAAYDEALRSVPDGADVRTLTGRSQASWDAMKPAQACADADLALQLQPNNLKAQMLKARAAFFMSEYERSIVINYRGSRMRKKPSYFREGVNQCSQTLNDCIGKNAGNVMLDFLPLIKQTEASRIDEEGTFRSVHVSRIPQPERKQKLTQIEEHKHATLARVMAMKYLGPMARDKFFLQNLLADPSLDSANSTGTAQLKTIINEALVTLGERQELLRSARPYYTIKLAENSDSKYQNKYKEAVLHTDREIGARTAERLLRQIEKSNQFNRVKDVIAQAERMQLFLDTKTPRTLPDKEHYTDRLYRDVGKAYLSQHRLSYTLSERGNRRRIAFLMGLPVGRAHSFDSVLANYPLKFMDIKQATQKILINLEMCENSMMKCWLTYELARLLCMQKNFPLSKFYAKRCQKEAQDVGSVTWWLNGCFVLMSGDMQQGNANEVRIHVEEAYEWSKRKPDSERVQSFLAKCAEMVAETVATDERKAIVHREREIVKVFPLEQRPDPEVLFKRMSSVPAGRRFSVLAGTGQRQEERSVRRRRHHRGLTVIPGPEKTLPAPPRTNTLGLQHFDL